MFCLVVCVCKCVNVQVLSMYVRENLECKLPFYAPCNDVLYIKHTVNITICDELENSLHDVHKCFT